MGSQNKIGAHHQLCAPPAVTLQSRNPSRDPWAPSPDDLEAEISQMEIEEALPKAFKWQGAGFGRMAC